MKIDVEGFEIEVLRGCMRALSDQRIRLVQVEWNDQSREGVETDRQPIADLLAECGYALYRPDEHGTLIPVSNPGFGPDVFAQPAHNLTALGESP
jgi:hypothetical protein